MSNENFDINQMMEAARAMQASMEEAHTKLTKTKFAGTSKNKRIKVTMMGTYEAKHISIDPSLMSEGADKLESMLLEAINDAVSQIENASKQHISGITSGLGGELGSLSSHQHDD